MVLLTVKQSQYSIGLINVLKEKKTQMRSSPLPDEAARIKKLFGKKKAETVKNWGSVFYKWDKIAGSPVHSLRLSGLL